LDVQFLDGHCTYLQGEQNRGKFLFGTCLDQCSPGWSTPPRFKRQNLNVIHYVAGSVDGLKTEAEVSELKDLGYQIKLKSSETLVQTASSNSPDSSVWQAFGFKEMDPPQKCLTDIPNFMLSPKQARYVNRSFFRSWMYSRHPNTEPLAVFGLYLLPVPGI
jgi:hypothetical protein